jgi:hypothetical protein
LPAFVLLSKMIACNFWRAWSGSKAILQFIN